MLNKTIVIFLAILSIMSVTSCSKKPKLDSDKNTTSNEDTSSDRAIGEVILFDEKELTEDLNYKLLNIMNERNYFNDSDELMYEIGEYSYRAYQDSEFPDCIYVIANPDDEETDIYMFIKSEENLKYIGLNKESYFDVVEHKKVVEGSFTYEEIFEPAYGDNGINYEVIANSIKKNYGNREFVDGSQGSKVYFRNQFSWDVSRGNGTYYYEMAAYAGIFIDVLILADSGNLYDDGIFLDGTYDSEYIFNINTPTPDELSNWHLGMMRYSLQELGFTEAHQRMVDRIIETSPYNFELKIGAAN